MLETVVVRAQVRPLLGDDPQRLVREADDRVGLARRRDGDERKDGRVPESERRRGHGLDEDPLALVHVRPHVEPHRRGRVEPRERPGQQLHLVEFGL